MSDKFSFIDENERLISRVLRDHEPDFQWVPTHRVDFKNLRKETWVNHFHCADFVTKTGLTGKVRKNFITTNPDSLTGLFVSSEIYESYDGVCTVSKC